MDLWTLDESSSEMDIIAANAKYFLTKILFTVCREWKHFTWDGDFKYKIDILFKKRTVVVNIFGVFLL